MRRRKGGPGKRRTRERERKRPRDPRGDGLRERETERWTDGDQRQRASQRPAERRQEGGVVRKGRGKKAKIIISHLFRILQFAISFFPLATLKTVGFLAFIHLCCRK